MPAPEIPVRAGVIPDSPIPDSPIPDYEITPPPSKEILILKTARARETRKEYDPVVGDAIDRRKLGDAFKEINLRLTASVGSGSSPGEKEIFEWACELAGISVERGLEVQARGKKWPQTQTMGASA